MILLDTNYILRYLLKDNLEMYEDARKIIECYDFFIPNEVLAEVVFVLQKFYKVPKETIVQTLKKFCLSDNVILNNQKIVFNSFEIYLEKNLDYVDALLCASKEKFEVKTFDKKLKKCISQI